MTITLDGASHPIDQVTKQLHKLVNVIKIRDLEPEETIAREMALFKVSADGQTPRRDHAARRHLPRPDHRRLEPHGHDRGDRHGTTRSRPSRRWCARSGWSRWCARARSRSPEARARPRTAVAPARAAIGRGASFAGASARPSERAARSGRPVVASVDRRSRPATSTSRLRVRRAGAPRSATSSGSSPTATALRSARSGAHGRSTGAGAATASRGGRALCRGDAGCRDRRLSSTLPARGPALGRRLRLRARRRRPRRIGLVSRRRCSSCRS